jgi:hypothetical protein
VKLARERFVEAVEALLGRTVLWGELDCSEVVALGVKAAGGPDQTKTHRAQTYHDETRKLGLAEFPRAGDLGFYGVNPKSVIHVVVFLGPGRVLSADGATPRITTLEAAKAAGAAVRIHPSERYRRDVPFLGWFRNDVVDALDFVMR